MPMDDALYLEHMPTTARKIASRANGLTRERYDTDEDVQIVFRRGGSRSASFIGDACCASA